MRIVVLHQAVTEQDTVEDQDVLVQVEAVSAALRQLGHTVFAVPCTLNLEYMLNQVEQCGRTWFSTWCSNRWAGPIR